MPKQNIGILYNSAREADYYKNILIKFPKNFFIAIINDLCEIKESKLIENELKKINQKYFFLSDFLLRKNKIDFVISTGLGPYHQYNLVNFFIFIYSRTIGNFFNFTKIAKLFIFFFGRSFTAGGKKSKLYQVIQLERKIAHKTINFPRGLDIAIKDYPGKRWLNSFDYFFCHCKIDAELLKKFKKEEFIKVIGYPRYSNQINYNQSLEKIKKDFKITNSKKILLWMPGTLNLPGGEIDNIKLWFKKVYDFSIVSNFNLILRPSPKIKIDQINFILELQKKYLFYLDLQKSRELVHLYNSADIVFVDYGGSVFSSLYMYKNTIILNLPKSHPFLKNKNLNAYSLELLMSNKFTSLNLEDENIENKILNSKENIFKLRNEIFGEEVDFFNEINNFFKNAGAKLHL